MSNPTIFIITYHHRHGTDVSAAKSENGAREIAAALAYDRCQEDVWSEEDVARFKAIIDTPFHLVDNVGAIALFEECEGKLYDGETIEITQTVLGD